MAKEELSRGLFGSAIAYMQSNRKQYEVKSTVVFDKNEPLNVSKMYIIIMLRDPSAKRKDKEGKWVKDNTWNFAYKTKKGCLTLRDFQMVRTIKWYKPRVVETVSRIHWKKDTKEYQRLSQFASKYKVCTAIMDSVSDCFKPATARYFETKTQMSTTDEVAQ